MAAQALGVHLFGRGLGGIEDLRHVAAALHVRLARAVAVLAGHAVVAVQQSHLGVRVGGKFLGHLFMAGGAGLATHKIRRARPPWPRGGLPPGAWAASTGTHNMPAPSNNIKQASNPSLLAGIAPNGNCVTGLSLCIEYRLECSRRRFRQKTIPAPANPDSADCAATRGLRRPDFCGRCSLCGASLHDRKITTSSS